MACWTTTQKANSGTWSKSPSPPQSLPSPRVADKASGTDLKTSKRQYWAIESQFHYRLDNVLEEDRSRVRNSNAALVLGIFRRVVTVLPLLGVGRKRSPTNAAPHAASLNISTPKTPGELSIWSPQNPRPLRKNLPIVHRQILYFALFTAMLQS